MAIAVVVAGVACGGDTDSVAAMVGGIVGAAVGKSGIPHEWLLGLWEPSRSIAWMERLSLQLATSVKTGKPAKPISAPILVIIVRNLCFLAIVLAHGFWRLIYFW